MNLLHEVLQAVMKQVCARSSLPSLCINSPSVIYFHLRNRICFPGQHKSFQLARQSRAKIF